MFGEKCPKCRKKIKKSFSLCPYCGLDLKREEDYGFLGRNDFAEEEFKLPFGFNMLMKPLIKELNKQMVELEKEMNVERQHKAESGNTKASFSVFVGVPGQKPIRISSDANKPQMLKNSPNVKREQIALPKIDFKRIKNVKSLVKKEPVSNIRRLSDRIIYEIQLPNVENIKDVGISIIENGIEIRAFAGKTLYIKEINIELPLVSYSFEDEAISLEFATGN
ncbi:hypothetical protein J4463_03570 [Candidatus Pacearchaeota archaeon]|nr:hypothetical protein [Candidatus Pacearchaeota archaeon]